MFSNCRVFWLVACLILPSTLLGQDKGQGGGEESSFGIFESRGEYFQFMSTVKREGQSNPDLMAMVPLLNDIVLQQPIGSTGQKYSATSTLGMLADSEVRKELEIVDEQFDDLNEVNDGIQKRFAAQLKQLDFSDTENMTAQIMKIRADAENELQSTLLPHQMERLRQMMLRNQLQRRNFVEIVTSEPLKSKFEISDKQSAALKNAEEEIKSELKEQIAQLQKRARRKLLANLNPGQQKQIEEVFGDAVLIEFPAAAPKRSKKVGKKRK